jgi:hypothetical protein
MRNTIYHDVVNVIENGEGDELEQAQAMQRQINSGTIWSLQGSMGRAAMDMINSGRCMVGKEAHSDYWGNLVPSRDMLKAGTKGTPDFVIEHMGKEWLDELLKGEEEA